MTEPPTGPSVQALSAFFTYLRDQGFTVSVAHYVRAQALLDSVGVGLSPPTVSDQGGQERLDLKTLLCPIFATSREEQRRFYEVFDAYPDSLTPPPADARPPTRTPEVGTQAQEIDGREWPKMALRYALFLVVTVLSITGLIYLSNATRDNRNNNSASQNTSVNANANVNSNATNGNVADPTGTLPGAQANTGFVVVGQAEPATVRAPVAGHVLSAIIIALVAWAAVELTRRLRLRRILARQHAKTPPYSWPLRVEQRPEVYNDEKFYVAARYLRRQQVGERRRIDLKATVAATVKALGFPTLKEKPDSKAPEYLLLIDRAAERDHQAHLFVELADALKRENVFVLRFLYQHDARLCFDEVGTPVSLVELRAKYAGYRLIVFGEGGGFINPNTNALEEWTNIFTGWRERALLTNAPRWGIREVALATRFVVLPAGTRSLLRLADLFVSAGPKPDDARPATLPLPPPVTAGAQDISSLRRYLGVRVFLWLCACTVYPELQWELTLSLGALPFMPAGLVREENLLRLARLHWFRAGVIPDNVRWQLIRQLSPEQERAIRAALVELLQHDESRPPAMTYAADAHQLELLAQSWLRGRSGESYGRLFRFLRSLPPSQVTRDRTLLRSLQLSPRSAFARRLTPQQRQIVYRCGVPGLGPSGPLLFLLTMLLGIALSALFYAGRARDPLSLLPSLFTSVINPSATQTPTPTAGKPVRIGFSMDTLKEERWLRDKALVEARAREVGADIVTQVANGDDAVQVRQCDNLLTQGVDVLIIVPHNGEIDASIVEKAHAADVRVISYDRLIKNSDVDLFVSHQVEKMGEMQADYALKHVPKGNYVLIGGAPTDNNSLFLRRGQMNILQPAIERADVKIISDQFARDSLATEALKITEDALTFTKNDIQAIIASNDGLAGGAIAGLDAAGLAGKVLVAGQDADLVSLQRIVKGTQTMTIYKPIKPLADSAVDSAVKLARGEALNAPDKVNNGKIDVPAILQEPQAVDKDNLMDTIIRDGYYRMEDVYKDVPRDQWPKQTADVERGPTGRSLLAAAVLLLCGVCLALKPR